MKKCTIVLLATMLVIGLSTATPVTAGEMKEKRSMPTVINLFPRVDDSIVSKYGEPPTWTDNPSTVSKRKALVEQARYNVYHYLANCSGGAQFFTSGPLEIRDSTQCGGDTVSFYAQVDYYKAKYVAIQRVADTYGRSVSTGYTESFKWAAYDYIQYRDALMCDIEIFPEFFEEGRMFMEEEIGTPDGPWAKSAMEAAEYVILHELGHFESYVSTQCAEYGLAPVSNSERQANVFASSVLRCR